MQERNLPPEPIWLLRLSVRTRDFQSCKRGSIPLGVTILRVGGIVSQVSHKHLEVGAVPAPAPSLGRVAEPGLMHRS